MSEREEAKKLTTKDRNKLKDSDFCGPNRSFPVTDCEHVRVARAYLNRSKFSDSTKAKIATCINKKAKKLKCNSEKASLNIEFGFKDLTVSEIKLSGTDIFSSTKDLVNASITGLNLIN